VLVASGGPEALAVWRHQAGEIDLLLTDVVMPHMSGRQLAEKLTTEQPDLPVLFVSGYAEDNVMRGQIVPSASAFLAKPFSSSALGDKVRELLDVASVAADVHRRDARLKIVR
jgi:CheY-like chemotaxis protein